MATFQITGIDQNVLEDIQYRAEEKGITMSGFIRMTLKAELKRLREEDK
jgi:antitoxin component of RelBE/YafQ-DinJ toxin-antitoxin module